MRYKRKYMPNQDIDAFDELYRQLAVADSRISELERRLSKRQVHGRWIEPALLNGVAQVTGTLEPFCYRIRTGGKPPQFKGHLNVLGATSPVIAFVIPADEINFPSDVIKYSVITNAAQTAFNIAMIKIEVATGNVTFTWPAS